MSYVVSFNSGEYGVGDEHEESIDFYGENLDRLITHVCNEDPTYPLTFREDRGEESKYGGNVRIGLFFSADEDGEDDYPTAVLFETNRNSLRLRLPTLVE